MGLIQHLALVSESSTVDLARTTVIAAALNKQIARDVAPLWGIQATVQAYPKLGDVPLDYWPMLIRDNIGNHAPGVHLNDDGQPFALISANQNIDVLSMTASHEAIEMLVDPTGDRLVAGSSPVPNQGRVMFIVEVCDPCQSARFAYTVNGLLVCDFYTPQYFNPVAAAGVQYSFTGAISKPRQVLQAGYLSWLEPISNHWWQLGWFGRQPKAQDIGVMSANDGSIRGQIDRKTRQATIKATAPARKNAKAAGLALADLQQPMEARAAALQQRISKMLRSTRRGQ